MLRILVCQEMPFVARELFAAGNTVFFPSCMWVPPLPEHVQDGLTTVVLWDPSDTKILQCGGRCGFSASETVVFGVNAV